jgi:hypothetical protein
MKLVSPTEVARIISAHTGEAFTRQAVHKAIGEGLIPFVIQGNKKLIDLDAPGARAYITDNSRQREQAKKNDKNSGARSTLKDRKPAKNTGRSEHGPGNLLNEDPYVIKQRGMIADMRIKELKAAALEKRLIPVEFIDGCYFRYMEQLHSTIERSAGVFISEVGASIIEDGEVTPAHIERFKKLVYESIHNNKLAVAKELEKYEPQL